MKSLGFQQDLHPKGSTGVEAGRGGVPQWGNSMRKGTGWIRDWRQWRQWRDGEGEWGVVGAGMGAL